MKGNLGRSRNTDLTPVCHYFRLTKLMHLPGKYNDPKTSSRGTVTVKTKITAAPSPTAVLTFFETARYEHIPKKYANTMLSTKTDLKNNSKCSIFLLFRLP